MKTYLYNSLFSGVSGLSKMALISVLMSKTSLLQYRHVIHSNLSSAPSDSTASDIETAGVEPELP